MKAHEEKPIGSRPGHVYPAYPSMWTWRIGKGRVTAAEIESWQLGPDLTESLYAEDIAEQP